MFKKIILFVLTLFLFVSCSSDYDKKLKISATTWIGYTPLFYAKENGWLEPLNIKLLNVSSLSENMYLYKAGNSDAYVGTQYEYNILSKDDSTLMPIMMFDRSYGGDIIMSNRSIEELKKSVTKIDAYLEMDSVNFILLKDFIKKYKLPDTSVNYINKDQAEISALKSKHINNPTIIVTYIPYNLTLKKSGFKEIVSTKDGLELLVVDAMFTTEKKFNEHEKQFKELKKLVDRSIVDLQKDPKKFYDTIKPYMLDMNYNEFKDSLNDIIWINKDLSPEFKQRLNDAGFQSKDLK